MCDHTYTYIHTYIHCLPIGFLFPIRSPGKADEEAAKLLVDKNRTMKRGCITVQACRVRRSTGRYGLSHSDQSRRDKWRGVTTPHY